MNIDENKVADLKATIEKLNKQLVELTTPKYEYPVWFQSKAGTEIWKFISLNEAICIEHKYHKFIENTFNYFSGIPHTSLEHWTQIPEPVQECTYPLWFKVKGAWAVIEFTGPTTGSVVIADATRPFGYTSTTWAPHTDTGVWVRLYDFKQPEFTYPAWFKNNRNNMIVKFTALNTGIVISVEVDEGYRLGGKCNSWQPHTDIDVWTQVPEPVQEFTYPIWFQNKNGSIFKFTSLFNSIDLRLGNKFEDVPHTDTTWWTQIPEPQPTEWEPRGGEWFVRHYGPVGTHVSDNDSRLFGTEYKTKEQAKWAMEKMRSFNRLLAYIAEFDVDEYGMQWEADWTNVYNNKCSIRYCHITNKWYLLYHTTMQYFTTYMSEQCAEALVKKLNNGEVEL